MEFRFSHEEEDLRAAVNDFVQKEIADKQLDRQKRVPEDIITKMSSLGYFSLKMPLEYGGERANWVDIGILVEEIAKGNAALAFLVTLTYEIGLMIQACAQKEVTDEWLPRLIQGRILGSIALTEPEEGSDFMALQSLAVKDGNRYVISGEKCPVSFGMQADFTILFAKTSNEAGGGRITAFLVPLGLSHINKSPIDTTGLLASTPASIAFDDVSIPVCNRLGNEGEGLGINRAFGLFSDLGRILSGLAALGVSQSALRSAIVYSRERHAFGRPIGQFQAVSEKIAEAATLVEAGRWLCYRALCLKDQNAPNTKESAMSASWCASTAYRIIEETLLIHGHTGYSDDHPFQQMLRDVLAFQLIPGTKQTLKLLIAQEVLGSIGVPKEMTGAVE